MARLPHSVAVMGAWGTWRAAGFVTYIGHKHVHHKSSVALVPRPLVDAGDKAVTINDVLNNDALVGAQEMFPLCLRTLTTLTGSPRAPGAKIRVNTEEENKVNMTPELKAELKRLNAMHIALFQAFTQRWRTIRDPKRDYLAAGARRGRLGEGRPEALPTQPGELVAL
jgi:hypothetical protein